MKVKVLIVEDELIIAEELKEKLLLIGYEVFGPTDEPQKAIEIAIKEQPDILLLDINLNAEIDGVELAVQLREKVNAGIIFLTAYGDSKTINRAKKVKPAAYMLKPYDDKNLAVAIDLAFANLSADNAEMENAYLVNNAFFVKEKQHFVKINLNDIMFIEAKGSYSDLVTYQKTITISMNLKNLLAGIDTSDIYRIHRSFAINIHKIEAFDGSQVVIGNKKLPIASNYKEDFLQRFRFI